MSIATSIAERLKPTITTLLPAIRAPSWNSLECMTGPANASRFGQSGIFFKLNMPGEMTK
jgi:hypothetical protein